MSGPNGEPQLHLGRGGEEEEEEEEGFGEAEYAAINHMLDQINSCLDHLEEKNDHLNTQLKELLESNRQTRLEFQQQQQLGQDGEPRKAQPDS
uniref:Bublin coiled coil protein n=1 Tax=Naja naja TaxID=35670 RepID=A0A8C6YD35_NAJNA